MSTRLRSATDLTRILDDLATGPYPEYIDDVLARTARIRPRPAWTFPERWLPMVDIARERAFAPRLPWRVIALAAVLVAIILAALSFAVGHRGLPAPFGLARNGLVAFDAGGELYSIDTVTGARKTLVSGPATDLGPQFSLDGTHIVFERKVEGGNSELFVARSDGTDLTRVTPTPVALTTDSTGTSWERYKFSPDGASILISTISDGTPSIAIANTDGSGIRKVEVGMPATELSFRPPDGSEILFVGGTDSELGIYAVNPKTGVVRSIVKHPSGRELGGANWSPDGMRIAYWSWNPDANGLTAKSRIIRTDGTGDRPLPEAQGEVWNAQSYWSNDGTRLFLLRGYSSDMSDQRAFVLPADGSTVGVEIAPTGTVQTQCCAAWKWSPDDTQILGRFADDGGLPKQQVLIDVATRQVRVTPWTSTSDPSWQRLSP